MRKGILVATFPSTIYYSNHLKPIKTIWTREVLCGFRDGQHWTAIFKMITPPSWHKKPWTGCITLLSTEVGQSLTKKTNCIIFWHGQSWPVPTSANFHPANDANSRSSQRTSSQGSWSPRRGSRKQGCAATRRGKAPAHYKRNWGCPGLSKIGDLGIPKSTKYNSPYTVLHRIAFGSFGKFCKHLPHLHNSRVAIGFQHALFQHLHLACEGDSDLILRLWIWLQWLQSTENCR